MHILCQLAGVVALWRTGYDGSHLPNKDVFVPEVRSRHLLVALAIAAIVLVTLVALLARSLEEARGPTFLAMAVIGIGMGWGGLGGCYLALGRQWLVARLALSTAIALAAGGICGLAADAGMLRRWCGVMLFAVFVVAVPLIYLWARGLRLMHPEHPPVEYWRPRSQFSLWGMLTAITCVSILLAIATRLEFPLDALYAVLVICGCVGGIPYVAGATLLSRLPAVWPALTIPAAMMAATLALHTLGPISVFHEITAALAETVVVTIWMLVLRIAGYRLHWPDYSALETVGPSKRLVDEHGQPVDAQDAASSSPPQTEPAALADDQSAQSNHSSAQSNFG